MKNKAIFFDKDNTLIKDQIYNCDFDRIEFFEDSINILKNLSNESFLLFIISNQSGINRNYFSKEYYLYQMNLLMDFFKKNNIKIIDHIFCPHTPDEKCLCRKPQIGMVKRLQAYYNIDLERSYLIGDRMSDIDLALSSNVIPIFIERGYPITESDKEKIRNDNEKHYILSNEYKKLIDQEKIYIIKSLSQLKEIINSKKNEK